MPDTGLPWEIPYAAPADLVRDWPALSEDVADAVAAGLSAAGNPGIGSNVVQALKTDSFTSSSTSYVAITGLTATITPTTDTSKILVFVSCNIRGRYDINVRLKRDSTVIGNDPWKNAGQGNVASNAQLTTLLSALYLDSPATTSAVTYSVEVKTSISSSFVVNADQTPTDLQAEVVLIEVAA